MKKDHIIPHLEFREDFRSEQSVLDNDLVITGSPTISNGISGFTTSNYLVIPKYNWRTSGSFLVKFVIKDHPGNNERVTETLTSQKNRFVWIASLNKYRHDFRIGAADINIYTNDVSALDNQTVYMCFTWDYNGTNTTLKSYVNGVLHQTAGPYAGHVLQYDGDLLIGNGSATPYTGTIYEMYFFNTVLTADDQLNIINGTFSKDLLPDESVLFLPCNDSYNNGSGNRVTSALGTAITEATLGNGVTAANFPTLQAGRRVFLFDGLDYINCGDHDDFSFTISQPFSIGCLLSLSSISLTQAIICKARGTLNQGEFALFISGYKIFFYLIDDSAGAYKRVYSDDIRTYTNADQQISLIVTYDGSTVVNINTVGIYINGVNRATSTSTSGTFVDVENTSYDLTIGVFENLINLMTGELGLPFIIDKCLSPLQVEYLDKLMQQWRRI